ncbi:phosphoglycerate mutase family protein [Enterococcus asini]|uniref:histidine phosphatase family protein n=1 Tax=Enterococcus asini TaxID=57732 RepID=UPI00288F7732|nr:histidine phosphatase family protein [Enterococcus asini]MDT2757772.1 phosphoglycerate mutase family protein [Enterococcus asini]
MTTIYLMRHGETLFNRLHKKQGWCDSPLTQLGIQQALVAKKYFKNNEITFDEAFCSTAERASDTLEIITPQPYTRLKGLKEWNFGRYEGQDEFLNPPQPYGDFFKTFEGEGETEVQERFNAAMLKIAKETTGQQILVVAHAAAIRAFMRLWEHTTEIPSLKRLTNCGILRFDFDSEQEQFHLQEVVEHDFSNLH